MNLALVPLNKHWILLIIGLLGFPSHRGPLTEYKIFKRAMAPHSSTLAWKISWTEEPGRLQSMRSLRVRHDWATSLSLFTFMRWRRKWQPTPVFLLGESQGPGEPGGLPSMGSHRVGHYWSNLAAAAAKAYDAEVLFHALVGHLSFIYLL